MYVKNNTVKPLKETQENIFTEFGTEKDFSSHEKKTKGKEIWIFLNLRWGPDKPTIS